MPLGAVADKRFPAVSFGREQADAILVFAIWGTWDALDLTEHDLDRLAQNIADARGQRRRIDDVLGCRRLRDVADLNSIPVGLDKLPLSEGDEIRELDVIDEGPFSRSVSEKEHVAVATENSAQCRQGAAAPGRRCADLGNVADVIADERHGIVIEWRHHHLANLSRRAARVIGTQHFDKIAFDADVVLAAVGALGSDMFGFLRPVSVGNFRTERGSAHGSRRWIDTRAERKH
jgi:hypothetical protein